MSSKSVNSNRIVLPNISSSTPQISYTQRYQHMTRLANYNQLNQGQIWKQYQKLRSCLKQINQQVLYHMQRKAYVNINNKQKPKVTKDSQATLILLEDQKKTNDVRYSNFYNQLIKLEQRIHFLTGKHNYLQTMTIQSQELQSKIKQTKKDNKDIQRKAKIVGKNIVNCTSALDKLVLQQDRLNRAIIRHRRFKQYLQNLSTKQQKYQQRIKQTDQAIDNRLKQFYSQQNYIQEQIHYEKYQQLKKQKQNLQKYQPIYKRNYLMKLKQLEGVINSITKHEKVIQENQTNILNVRNQIQTISQLVSKNSISNSMTGKKRSTSSALNMTINPIRIRSKQNKQRQNTNNISMSIEMKQSMKDPNILTTRKRVISHMNDKNDNLHNQLQKL